jgi:hypothetical protein
VPDADPDHIRERLEFLGLRYQDFAATVPVAVNTLTAAMRGGAPRVRARILARLREVEAAEGVLRGNAPDAAKIRAIVNLLLDSEIRDARLRFGSSGRTRFVTIFAHDPGMNEEELAEEERRWWAARDLGGSQS